MRLTKQVIYARFKPWCCNKFHRLGSAIGADENRTEETRVMHVLGGFKELCSREL